MINKYSLNILRDLPLITLNDIIVYKPFNCKIQNFDKEKNNKINKVNIVEGSYCLNPYFGKYYDLSIFLMVYIFLKRTLITTLLLKCQDFPVL